MIKFVLKMKAQCRGREQFECIEYMALMRKHEIVDRKNKLQAECL